jgi:hypothetical protein
MTSQALLKTWLVTAEMGYGHHRAIHALAGLTSNPVLTVGRNAAGSPHERRLWNRFLWIYEFFSRARGIPFFGKPIFSMLDFLLKIPSSYPIRDLSESTLQVELLASSIRSGLCDGMLKTIATQRLPLVTSFYAPAIAADAAGYDPVYCIICDADLNRVWVAKEPWESRIRYFAPCGRAAQRLRAYGVREERIFVTGFPLPKELLGGPDLPVLKADLGKRLATLDINGKFRRHHGRNVEHFLGEGAIESAPDRPLTISYAVGGAGAQSGMGIRITRTLARHINEGRIRVNLVAGTRPEVRDLFLELKEEIAPGSDLLQVIYHDSHNGYFDIFNNALHSTDMLWTKPSELSFFSGLGIPIIMTPTIGSHEKFNRRWLQEIQAGLRQEQLDHVDHWLFEWIQTGRLAEAAWSGFLKARKLGIYKIEEILKTGAMTTSDSPLHR